MAIASRPSCATARCDCGRATSRTPRTTSPTSPRPAPGSTRGRRSSMARSSRSTSRARPRFSLLQDRTGHPHRPACPERQARPRRRPAPLVYQAFDLLYLDGRSLRRRPARGAQAAAPQSRLRPHPTGALRRPCRGRRASTFYEAAASRSVEGIVAKLRRSPYEPGRRSRAWLKLKIRREQEARRRRLAAGPGDTADLGSLHRRRAHGRRAGSRGRRSAAASTRATRRALRAQLEELERRRLAGRARAAAAGRALGRAAPRDPRRVRRVDRGRPAAPGGLQGPRAGKDPRDGTPRACRLGRRARATAEAELEPQRTARPMARRTTSSRRSTPSRRRALGRRGARDPGHEPRQGRCPGRTASRRSPSATCSATTSHRRRCSCRTSTAVG